MALPSFLKRQPAPAPAPDGDAAVQRARTHARRRLVGAAVLLAAGVIAFPLLFETQPRPIPVDIPIEIPRKDGQPPLAAPPKGARMSGGAVADPAVGAVSEPVAAASASTAAPAALAASASAARAVPPVASAPAAPSARPASAAAIAKAPASAPSARPVAAPVAKPAASAPSPAPAAADGGRYVVQVGAFAEVTAAREVRMKVEGLGLKTYTQVIETSQGKRIRVRVGPFGSQAEADKVLARLKAAKLPGAVLTL